MTSTYLHDKFRRVFDSQRFDFKNVVEVGSRDGLDAMQLAYYYPNAIIHAFECNPEMINICKQNIQSDRIIFNPIGLGETSGQLEFFAYTPDNPGASSFFKRIDADTTQHSTGIIDITTLYDYAKDIDKIDLLCMDVQGFELNILKGCKDKIKNVRYVILEEPKRVIDERYLPKEFHSKYIGAPKPEEIQMFFSQNNFVEIARIHENALEDNVLYKNVKDY